MNTHHSLWSRGAFLGQVPVAPEEEYPYDTSYMTEPEGGMNLNEDGTELSDRDIRYQEGLDRSMEAIMEVQDRLLNEENGIIPRANDLRDKLSPKESWKSVRSVKDKYAAELAELDEKYELQLGLFHSLWRGYDDIVAKLKRKPLPEGGDFLTIEERLLPGEAPVVEYPPIATGEKVEDIEELPEPVPMTPVEYNLWMDTLTPVETKPIDPDAYKPPAAPPLPVPKPKQSPTSLRPTPSRPPTPTGGRRQPPTPATPSWQQYADWGPSGGSNVPTGGGVPQTTYDGGSYQPPAGDTYDPSQGMVPTGLSGIPSRSFLGMGRSIWG